MPDNNQPIDLGTITIGGDPRKSANTTGSSLGNDPQNVLTNLLATISQQNSSGNTSGSPTGLPQAAIDAASKVQKDYYTQHAQDLVASNPNGIAILNGMIDMHNNQGNVNGNVASNPTQPSPASQPMQNTQMSIDDQIAQINKQAALNVAKANLEASKPQGFLKRFSNNVAKMEGAVTQDDLLKNMGTMQKNAGQEPLQQADIQKALLDTQQKINQAIMVPPTQAESMQNAAAYAGYKTAALKDMLDNNNTAQTQQNETLKNMQGYSSWFNKPLGTMPKEAQAAVKKLKQLQLERIAIGSKLNEHQKLLANGGSSKDNFVEGKTYTDANGNTAVYKNGKFQ